MYYQGQCTIGQVFPNLESNTTRGEENKELKTISITMMAARSYSGYEFNALHRHLDSQESD